MSHSHRFLPPLSLIAAFCLLIPAAAAQSALRQNVLILLADDLGVDKISCYQPGTTPPPPNTPNIDALAANGVRFLNAYSMPLCSPTRACIMTGRYGFRTGIGTNVRSNNTNTVLGPMSPSEITLPEMLDAAGSGYQHVAIGKWHLGYYQNLAIAGDPFNQGFGHFAGTKGNFATRTLPPQTFVNWPKTIEGYTQTSTTYVTVDNIDEAIAFTDAQSTDPWLCYVGFNAPHVPLLRPPGFALPHSAPVAGEDWWPYHSAMIEHMDAEIGRLLTHMSTHDPVAFGRTLVLFLGDNGTGGEISGPGQLVFPPFDSGRAKGTAFEAGVHVPLIAFGAVIDQPGRTSAALVHVVDLFATIAEIAGVNLADPNVIPAGRTLDSLSFLPLLTQASAPGVRQQVMCETFAANNPQPGTTPASRRSLRDIRYKLIRDSILQPPGDVQFYDLLSDPMELDDLLSHPGGLSPSELQAFTGLSSDLDALLISP